MNEQNEKQVTLNDYLRIFFRGRWIILISFFTVFGFVAYYTFTTTPVYEATATVMIKENRSASKTLFANLKNFVNSSSQLFSSAESTAP